MSGAGDDLYREGTRDSWQVSEEGREWVGGEGAAKFSCAHLSAKLYLVKGGQEKRKKDGELEHVLGWGVGAGENMCIVCFLLCQVLTDPYRGYVYSPIPS